MLIQLEVNQSLAKCHSLAERIPGKSLVWNGTNWELAVGKEKNEPKFWASVVVFAIGSFLYGINGAIALKSDDLGMTAICAYFSIVGATIGLTLVLFRKNEAFAVEFLNGILQFAENWKNDAIFQETARPSALVKLFCGTLTTTQVVNPWLLSLVAMAWPCSPLSMFSCVNPWCDEQQAGGSQWSMAAWVGFAIANFGSGLAHLAFWRAVYSQAYIDVLHVFLDALCQEKLLRFLGKRIQVSAAGGSQFDVGLYRSLQLLNTCFNNYATSILFTMVTSLTVAETATAYVILDSFRGDSNYSPLVTMFAFEACPIVFAMHMAIIREAGRVYSLSASVLAKAVKANVTNCKGRSRLLTHRYIRSAWYAKVKLGKGNFVDEETGLVMLDFTLTRVVDLLLLESQGGTVAI